jgi:mono/diheme cytochrome c family protein
MRTKVSLLGLALVQAAMAGNPDRGQAVVQNQGCLECHTVNAAGASHESILPAPDLASRLASTYTPAALASAVWNHTPQMWRDLTNKRALPPAMSDRDWEDAFAYLYSLQFFELPEETGRGRATFDKKCGGCHSDTGPGPLPSRGSGVANPVELVYQMWNHAPRMSAQAKTQRKQWQQLSGREMLDLTAYLQTLRNEAPNRRLSLPPAAEGRAPFGQYCAQCHNGGARALQTRLRNRTWMDIAAGMWNHVPEMRGASPVPAEDMPRILAYVWDLQYQGPAGNANEGRRTFNSKRCITCHRDAITGQPKSPRPCQTLTAFSIVGLSWGQSRAMHQRMESQGVPWPTLAPQEVSNLVAFLNSISRR